jgi:serine/threonine-protein kinase RIO1
MLTQDCVHADLSAFNVLYWEGAIRIIDFPQAVNPWINADAFELFERDVVRLSGYFARYGLAHDGRRLAAELWSRARPPGPDGLRLPDWRPGGGPTCAHRMSRRARDGEHKVRRYGREGAMPRAPGANHPSRGFGRTLCSPGPAREPARWSFAATSTQGQRRLSTGAAQLTARLEPRDD